MKNHAQSIWITHSKVSMRNLKKIEAKVEQVFSEIKSNFGVTLDCLDWYYFEDHANYYIFEEFRVLFKLKAAPHATNICDSFESVYPQDTLDHEIIIKRFFDEVDYFSLYFFGVPNMRISSGFSCSLILKLARVKPFSYEEFKEFLQTIWPLAANYFLYDKKKKAALLVTHYGTRSYKKL